jgi:hypothetical protein
MNKILYLLVISLLYFNSAQAVENIKNAQKVKVEYSRVSYNINKQQLNELLSETLGKNYSVNLNHGTDIFKINSAKDLKRLDLEFSKSLAKSSTLSWSGVCSFNQPTCGSSMLMTNADHMTVSSEKVSAQLEYADNKTFLTINSYKTTGDKRTHNIKTFNYPTVKLDINYKYYLVVMNQEQQSIQNSSITLVKIEEFRPQDEPIKIANIKGIN